MSTETHTDAFKDTHAALNDLLGFVLHTWPEIREYLIYDKCLRRLALNRATLEDAPLSGNFYQEAEALVEFHPHKGGTMNSTTSAPAAPDLSSLTPRQRLNARVAETQGWEVWHYPPDTVSYLFEPGRFTDISPAEMVFVRGHGNKPVMLAPYTAIPVPDYAGDPAAWGALMAKELGGWNCAEGAAHRCWWYEDDGSRTYGPWCASLPVAACATVLKRHGIDPTPYIGGERQ
jgi:hypothetical protein